MSEKHTIDTALLRLKDARRLAPLLAAHAQSLKRGAPRRPDEYYAEMLLQDRSAEILGAQVDGTLVGFAIFHDLPEPVSGRRCGLMEHLYVHHEHRRQGIAKALIDVLADQAEERGWSKLTLTAPRRPDEGRKLYKRIAVPADRTSYVIRFDEA